MRHCQISSPQAAAVLDAYNQRYLFCYNFQTQSCDWRSPKSVGGRRKRRDLDGVEIDDIDETEIDARGEAALNKSLSESLSLFQAIHVLQTKEDELALRNETTAGKFL